MQSRFGAVNAAASRTWQKPFTLCFGGSRRRLGLLLPEIPANPIEIKASSTWRVSNLKGLTRRQDVEHCSTPSAHHPCDNLDHPCDNLNHPWDNLEGC